MKITNIHQRMTEAEFLKNINRENFVPPKKGDGEIAASLQISDDAQKRFEAEIKHLDRRIALPVYSGIYETDKAIAVAVEGCSKEEQIFVYNIIGQNFLKENTSSLTEEERQANISLGMKKAEYAARNFIPEKSREKFLDAMKNIAKIASAGKADKNGNMDYGITKSKYLGHGSGLVEETDTLDVMKHMDPAAYEEYQRIREESNDEENMFKAFRYLLDWHERAVKKNPNLMKDYEKINKEYFEKEVNNKKLPTYFEDVDTSSKEAFLSGLRDFMAKHQNFLSGLLSAELSGLLSAELSGKSWWD